ncbi:hypothetical protein [Candidatus Allofournierella merdipullorum]|uniref:hypothetical protein n=1 Tax=Candidatus Allofournierella merdipullorum TaxID=2838595 RepID=UPI003AB54DDE
MVGDLSFLTGRRGGVMPVSLLCPVRKDTAPERKTQGESKSVEKGGRAIAPPQKKNGPAGPFFEKITQIVCGI